MKTTMREKPSSGNPAGPQNADVDAALLDPTSGDDWSAERIEHLTQTAAELCDRLSERSAEVARLTRRVQWTHQWYAERWQTMHDWFRSQEMKGSEATRKWFNIVANGTPNHSDPPTYAQQLNTAIYRAEAAEKRAQSAEAALLAANEKIAEARADAAHWRSEHDRVSGMYFDRWEELKAAKAEIAGLRTACEPFVKALESWNLNGCSYGDYVNVNWARALVAALATEEKEKSDAAL